MYHGWLHITPPSPASVSRRLRGTSQTGSTLDSFRKRLRVKSRLILMMFELSILFDGKHDIRFASPCNSNELQPILSYLMFYFRAEVSRYSFMAFFDRMSYYLVIVYIFRAREFVCQRGIKWEFATYAANTTKNILISSITAEFRWQ